MKFEDKIFIKLLNNFYATLLLAEFYFNKRHVYFPDKIVPVKILKIICF